ncbi:HtaA domain-containing protein [uncultured Microbacterium sp.]|uniref:HtaA domain-containing protein n=1 Tax=uncultured Microbacterium sp. TaxID=191216 RepID=UPI00262D4749|nr:HtaA domain-containing protein [uncultured Microbacterium sp.]
MNPAGESITVTAENYDGSADGKYTPGKAGFYLQVGWIAEDWRPSEGAASANRANAFSTWVSDEAATAAPTKWTVNADGTVSASWTVEIDQASLDEALAAKPIPGARLAVFSIAAGGATVAGNELAVPIAFGNGGGEDPNGPDKPEVPNKPETPAKPTTPPASVAGGSMRWAISSSFVSYITGRIAQGEISVFNGATRSGGLFQFGQAAGSTYYVKTGLGSVGYTGSVRFTGHHGVLDVTVSNPRIEITSASNATLYVTHGGSRVAFATVNLAAATKTTANGVVTYTAAPTALTAAGQSSVLNGYSTVLDPVTFTVGTPAAAPGGTVGTVAAASVAPKATLPAAPPASQGVMIDAENLEALQTGEKATVSADGFQAGEQGIKVVVYSTPVLLDTVTADADGVASWTGTLPATLENGAHTITFQGSVDRGLEFTLERETAAVIGKCTVEGATLNWGYKESFRNYIEGIAHGGWDLEGLEYRYPEFVWGDGTGSYDDETGNGLVDFGGTIVFNGHDGALNTHLSNARVELAGDTGYIVFDITGTTQGGEAVDQKSVRFVEFSMADAVTENGVIALSGAESVLTESGSAAFGTYAAGEAFDPVSFSIPVGEECGIVPVAEEEASEPEAAAVTTAQIEPISAEAGFPLWAWILIGVLVAGAGVGGGMLIQRRRTPASASISQD